MTTTTAAVLYEPGDLRIEPREIRDPGPGEVLIRVGVCGVCGSDATEYGRSLVLGEPPVALGHEFAGTIEAVGEGVTSLAVGATVVCGAGISCGECKPCRNGRTNLCRKYKTLGFAYDGGLAGYVVAPADIVLDVTATGLPMDTLGLAQPMAIAVHTVRRSGLKAGDDAVIVGVGGIGVFITVAALGVGARVLVVDLNEERLELAKGLGATETLVAGTKPLAEAIDELGFDVDVFFEVSGSRPGLQSVLEASRPGVTIVPVGIQRGEPELPLGNWTLREMKVVGTVAHVFKTDFPDAIALLQSRPDWSDVAPEAFPLDRLVPDVLEPLLDGSAQQIKALVDPWISEPRKALHAR